MPLIAPEEWDAYLESRRRRRVYRRSERSLYAFSGMVWCACGSKMHGGAHGADRAPVYRCKDAKEKGKHAGSYVQESTIDVAVRGWLDEREDRIRQEAAEAIIQRPQRITSDPTDDTKRRLAQLANKQVSLIEGRLEIGIPQAAYVTLRDRYAAEQTALEQELRTTEVRKAAPLRVLPILLERWDDLDVGERREFLRTVSARIAVTPGGHRAHIDIAGHGDD